MSAAVTRGSPLLDSNAYDDVARRYRTLVEQLPLVVYVDALDAASSNIFTSRQIEGAARLHRRAMARRRGPLRAALPSGGRDRVLEAHAQTHATHDPFSVEYRLKARDGPSSGSGTRAWSSSPRTAAALPSGLPAGHHRRARGARPSSASYALYDALTGLANRAFFHEQFQHTVSSMRKEPNLQTALLFMGPRTTSRMSTIGGATTSATSCSRRSASRSRTLSAPVTRLHASAATSSRSFIPRRSPSPAEAVRWWLDRLLEAIPGADRACPPAARRSTSSYRHLGR